MTYQFYKIYVIKLVNIYIYIYIYDDFNHWEHERFKKKKICTLL